MNLVSCGALISHKSQRLPVIQENHEVPYNLFLDFVIDQSI